MNGMLPLVLGSLLVCGCSSPQAREPYSPATRLVAERGPLGRETALTEQKIPNAETQRQADISQRQERETKRKAIQDWFEQGLTKLESKPTGPSPAQ